MTGLFRGDDLERELRARRPHPGDELVRQIEGRIRVERLATRRSYRVALSAVFTVVVVGGLAAVGGVSYAASSVVNAARTVSHVFAPASANRVVVVESLTSGGDQYKPGYGWGDPHHNHPGPPKCTPPAPPKGKKPPRGFFTPPLTPKVSGGMSTVSTSMTIDEQAHLFVSVFDQKTRKELPIVQDDSKIGGKLSGKAATTVNYLELIPRTIPLKIAIPSADLKPGEAYAIRVIARAPNGAATTVEFPFNG
jgi:hypothetical protein